MYSYSDCDLVFPIKVRGNCKGVDLEVCFRFRFSLIKLRFNSDSALSRSGASTDCLTVSDVLVTYQRTADHWLPSRWSNEAAIN